MLLRFRLLLIPVLAFAPALFVRAEPPASQPATDVVTASRFLRFTGDSKNGGKLETSDVKLTNDAGVTVHLVSAVHIGEPSYYHELQKTFANCDAVLYEMVKAKDAAAPVRGQHSDSSISK